MKNTSLSFIIHFILPSIVLLSSCQKGAEIKFNINNLLNQEQFIYVNRFAPFNPFGYNGGDKSIEEYPGVGEAIAPERLDPKGTSYSKDYDTKIRTNRYGINYSPYFTYRF